MSEPILTVEDLSVRIAGLHILQGVSFAVAPTGVTVLLGRNGVGKTTTLRAIVGLTPTGGEVRGTIRMRAQSLLAQPTHRLSAPGWRAQDRRTFAGPMVAENLRLAGTAHHPGVRQGLLTLLNGPARRQRADPLRRSRCSRSAGCCSTTTGCCWSTSRPRGWRRRW
jgi:ABC-type branched-subunit amino acid transport system ATPase component